MTIAEIINEAKSRVSKIKFGEPVTNIFAGIKNPMRHAYFVEYVIKSHKNKFGVTHRDYLAKITNGKKKFWNIDIIAVFPGHLSEDKCSELSKPIHQVQFGE